MPAPKPTPETYESQFKLRAVILIALGTLVAAVVVAALAYYAGMNK